MQYFYSGILPYKIELKLPTWQVRNILSNMSIKALLFAFLLASMACVAAYNTNIPTKKRLTDIKAITLHVGKQSTWRRATSQQQLQCHGHLCQYAPDTVQCTNMGTDGLAVQWSCEADLPATLSFKDSDVNCEGWDWPEDPYVLVGSCTLSYSLKGVPPSNIPNTVMTDVPYEKSTSIFPVLLVGLVIFLCISGCHNGSDRYGNRRRGFNDFAAGVATGAATTYALGGHRRRGWGGGWGGARRTGRWGGRNTRCFGSTGRRSAKTFPSTTRR